MLKYWGKGIITGFDRIFTTSVLYFFTLMRRDSTLATVISGLIREEIIEYLYRDNKHDVNQKLKLSTKN